MDSEWKWFKLNKNNNKRRRDYELWNIWWTICTTRIKRKII